MLAICWISGGCAGLNGGKRVGQQSTVPNSVGMKLANVPPGGFLMGSPITEGDTQSLQFSLEAKKTVAKHS